MELELDKIAKDWDWLLDLSAYRVISISPFGDLFLKDASDTFSLLDVNMGVLEFAQWSGTDPAVLFPIRFDDRIAAGYREAGLVLTEGQCYGLKIQGVAGGSFALENIYIATLAEYVSFMGDFHRQIQDVPDGGTVTLKVINQKVIQ